MTGANTYLGRTAAIVRAAQSGSTEQRTIFAVTRNLATINAAVAALIAAYAYSTALPPSDLIRLSLTALLATIPVALPATFTLSAAFAAQLLAKQGVLLTRLSAAHEAAAMDVLCADKTGTLTRNALEVVDVVAMPGFDRQRVLELAALASSEANEDTIDAAVRQAASSIHGLGEHLVRFVPFDPATRMSQAFAVGADGASLSVAKGAVQAIAGIANLTGEARQSSDAMAAQGHRVIAVASGTRPRCGWPASSP